jgi:hypothetical protein
MTLAGFMKSRVARVPQDSTVRRNTFLLFFTDEELNEVTGKFADAEVNLEIQREIEIRKNESDVTTNDNGNSM